MTLASKLTGKLDFTYVTAVGGENVVYQPSIDLADTLATGVALDTADLLYFAKAVALTGSGSNNHDVAGSLADAFGATLSFVKIKLLFIRNLSTTAGNTITVGNATNPLLIFGSATHTHTIGPDGMLLIWEPSLAGKAVTASTGDILKVANNTANNVTYDLVIAGTSA
jgi:hypothetical protein